MTKLLMMIMLSLAVTGFSFGEALIWGVNGHPMNQASYFTMPLARQLEHVTALGAGWYRFGVSFHDLRANANRLDELVREANQRGVRLLPVLLSDLIWEESSAPERIFEEAREFGAQMASRYSGQITHWELDNELDIYALVQKGEAMPSGDKWLWDNGPDGSSKDHYQNERFAKAKAQILGLYKGIKSINEHALTMANTAGWHHYGFLERLVEEEGKTPFDLLAWHWYSVHGDITNVEGKVNVLERIEKFGKPIWITEINQWDGDKDGTGADQLAYFRNDIKKLLSYPSIRAIFVYELLDQPYFGHDGQSTYGLIEIESLPNDNFREGKPKPVYEVFKELTKLP